MNCYSVILTCLHIHILPRGWWLCLHGNLKWAFSFLLLANSVSPFTCFFLILMITSFGFFLSILLSLWGHNLFYERNELVNYQKITTTQHKPLLVGITSTCVTVRLIFRSWSPLSPPSSSPERCISSGCRSKTASWPKLGLMSGIKDCKKRRIYYGTFR